MRKILHIITAISLTLTSFLASATLPVPNNLIPYNSTEGKQLLLRSADDKFLQLSMQFVTQKTQTYCGVASINMALNALQVQGPEDPIYAPYRPITQDNFFTVATVLNQNQVAQHGMTLDEAALAAQQFSIKSQAIHSDSLTLDKMRELLKNSLHTPNEYAIINFFRPGLKEQGGGHFSPIAAYDATTDRFLILDVARFRYPPVWAKTTDIWNAINTMDNSSQKKRGILLIKKVGK